MREVILWKLCILTLTLKAGYLNERKKSTEAKRKNSSHRTILFVFLSSWSECSSTPVISNLMDIVSLVVSRIQFGSGETRPWCESFDSGVARRGGQSGGRFQDPFAKAFSGVAKRPWRQQFAAKRLGRLRQCGA